MLRSMAIVSMAIIMVEQPSCCRNDSRMSWAMFWMYMALLLSYLVDLGKCLYYIAVQKLVYQDRNWYHQCVTSNICNNFQNDPPASRRPLTWLLSNRTKRPSIYFCVMIHVCTGVFQHTELYHIIHHDLKLTYMVPWHECHYVTKWHHPSRCCNFIFCRCI